MKRVEQPASGAKKGREPGVSCPAEATLGVVGGRWKVPILWHLLDGTRRFSELRRALGNVTPKMLAQQLRELERDGVVARKVYPQVPPKVEYSLTERGRSLRPVVDSMCQWGKGKPCGGRASPSTKPGRRREAKALR